MTRLRRTAGLASAALLTFALSACGGSDYCDLIESSEDDFSDFSETDFMSDPEVAGQIQERFQEIADAAPDDVTDQWQNMADAIGLLADAEGDSANLDEEAMSDMQSMGEDMAAVQESVQEECDIDMSL